MFKKHWDKRRKENPNEPKYISLCYILEGSGEDRNIIENIFLLYLTIKIDYDAGEEEEMINYLFKIAKDK